LFYVYVICSDSVAVFEVIRGIVVTPAWMQEYFISEWNEAHFRVVTSKLYF